MDRISQVSCAAYRHTVRDDPRFVPYFRQATPELELGRLNIGSRPSKRNPKGGVERYYINECCLFIDVPTAFFFSHEISPA